MVSRRNLLAGALASAVVPRAVFAKSIAVDPASAIEAALQRSDTLPYYAAKRGLLFGGIVERDYTVPGAYSYDAAYSAEVVRESSLLNVNDIGPGLSRKHPDRFDFYTGDKEVEFALSNNRVISGGGLAVHDGVPHWITSSTDRATALAELKNIVNTTMNHYSGKLWFWGVSNEAIKVGEGPFNFRPCIWKDTIGDDISSGTDYVTEGFRAARAADPSARLIYNDFGIEDGDRNSTLKRAAVLNLLTALKKANLIDGLGIQSHLNATGKFDPTQFRLFLDAVHGLGLDIMITELDVFDKLAPSDISTRDAIVAERIASYLDVVLNHSGVRSLTVWGIADKYSWYNARWFPQYARADGLPQRPDLLDFDLKKKPAYYAVENALRGRTT